MNSSEPLVSVVIPAYNAERFIAQAMASVLSQDYRALELFVVDDGSTDETRDLAESVGDPRVVVLSGPNRGVSHARNTGLQHARGEAIAFLDADDYWLSNKTAMQLSALVDNPAVVAVGSLMRYESVDGRILGTAGQKLTLEDQELIARAQLMPFPLSSVLFRSDVFAEVGGFDEGLRYAQDVEFMSRVAAAGPVDCASEVLGVYRIHGDSVSALHNSLQRASVRFVRVRLAERERGGDLSWDEFIDGYRPDWRQSYGDQVQAWYRTAGLRAAEQRWMRAVGYGLLALLTGPRYTAKRLLRQRFQPVP